MRDRGRMETVLSVRASDQAQAEGDAGATSFTFVVTRKGALQAETTFDWSVAGAGRNPAEAADFPGAAFPGGTLTFAAGERRKVITVEVVGDLRPEGSEEFVFRISADREAAHVRRAEARATIVEDDRPVVTTDALGEEGDPGPTTLAIGEEGEATTLAIGEEGDPDPIVTTLAVGEEGDPGPTTLALGEEGDATTQAVGEEGEPGPIVTTLAIGEEGAETVSAEDSSPFGA